MMQGIWHKVMRVNLTTGVCGIEEVPDEVYDYFLGGSGLGAYFLWKECPAGTKAFDPENRLILATGPNQSSKQSGSAKWSAISIGPQLEMNSESACTASFGYELKSCGFDAMVIHGKAPHPVYIAVNDDKAEVKDATPMWGKDAYVTDDMITEQEGNEPVVLTIGQAAERLVRIANVQTAKKSYLGRGGLGAVMGSKNLKGISLKGTMDHPALYDPDEIKRLNREIAGKMVTSQSRKPKELQMRVLGTAFVTNKFASQGNLPVKNYSLSEEDFPSGLKTLGGVHYLETLDAKPWPCKFCVLQCHNKVTVKEGKYAYHGKGPEYESFAMMGFNVLVDDMDAVAYAGELANKYSMDTISLGSIIAWAMESYEKGVITKEDTYGIDLKWGDADAMIAMIEKMTERAPGLGFALGEGTGYAAKVYGKGSEDWAVQMKGVEIAAHNWRAQYISALNYCTGCACGPNHERGNSQHIYVAPIYLPEWGIDEVTSPASERWSWPGMAERNAKFHDYNNVINSFVRCKFQDFGGYSLTDNLNTFNAITGYTWTQDDLRKCGERITTLQKMLTMRYGWKKEMDFAYPKRFMEPVDKGVAAGKIPIGLEDAIMEYYQVREWDEEGRPTRGLIDRMGMEKYAATEEKMQHIF